MNVTRPMNDTLNHRYFPALSAREAEAKAYSTLCDAIKDRMLPIITLNREREAPSPAASLGTILSAAEGRPIIIDFDPEPKPVQSATERAAEIASRDAKRISQGKRPSSEKERARWLGLRAQTEEYNRAVVRLSLPDDGYRAWREFSLAAPNLIPLVRQDEPVQAAVQVDAIVAAGRRWAFRINVAEPMSAARFLAMTPQVSRRPDLVIVILDAGHVRGDVHGATRSIARSLEAMRAHIPTHFDAVLKVCLSGSFPATVRDLASPLRIQERDVFDGIRALGWDARYGDYASVFRRSAQGGANGWLPHVEVAHGREWHFRLSDRNSDAQGYVECAQALVADSSVWAPRSTSWGTAKVLAASQGTLTDGRTKLTTPGKWIGIRVSQHLTCQASMP
jgi:Beta protein